MLMRHILKYIDLTIINIYFLTRIHYLKKDNNRFRSPHNLLQLFPIQDKHRKQMIRKRNAQSIQDAVSVI